MAGFENGLFFGLVWVDLFLKQRESVMRRQFASEPTTHLPEVHALPRDHDVAQQQMLTPCEDLQWLFDKYRRDVASIFGIPHEMLIGTQSGGHETVKKTMASGRLFSTNMHEICWHLQRLLVNVYHKIYRHSRSVEFTMVPMPRLEIESIEDFKVLFEIGALTPDMSIKLSRMLLGEEGGIGKKQKVPAKNLVEGGEETSLREEMNSHGFEKKEKEGANKDGNKEKVEAKEGANKPRNK